jgi:DNA-directed RNA polymerase subunit RPC12/RpoP
MSSEREKTFDYNNVCVSGIAIGPFRYSPKVAIKCGYCGSSFLAFGLGYNCLNCGAPFREDDFYEYNF